MSDLASKTCVPCKGGVPPLAGKELEALAKQVPEWKVVNGHHLVRSFTFPDFRQALAFVNKVGEIAEAARVTIRIFCWRGERRKLPPGRTRSTGSPKATSFWQRKSTG